MHYPGVFGFGLSPEALKGAMARWAEEPNLATSKLRRLGMGVGEASVCV
jgi:hypothetical protein